METLELILQRTVQDAGGTSGSLSGPAGFICYTIELPWKNNQKKISCVIAGRYELKKEDSPAHGICLELLNVPGRGDCQFHKMNWANGKKGKMPESHGCIGPVSRLEPGQPGVGWSSGDALAKLEGLCFPVIDKGGKVFVTIIDVPSPATIARAAQRSTPNSRVGAVAAVTR